MRLVQNLGQVMDESNPVVLHAVRLAHSESFKMLRSELAQLGIRCELADQLRFVREFAEIAERDLFSRQIGYAGEKN